MKDETETVLTVFIFVVWSSRSNSWDTEWISYVIFHSCGRVPHARASVDGVTMLYLLYQSVATLNKTVYERRLANEVLKSKQLKRLELELLTHSTPDARLFCCALSSRGHSQNAKQDHRCFCSFSVFKDASSMFD